MDPTSSQTLHGSGLAIVRIGRRRVAVLTEAPASPDAFNRLDRALGRLTARPSGSIDVDATALLGAGSATCDLTFCSLQVAERPDRGANSRELAVASALTARLVGQVLAEATLVVMRPLDRSRWEMTPPARWWSGDWQVRFRGGQPARLSAELVLHGEIVLPE